MSSSALQIAKTATYLPDLVEVQRASFKWFLEKGLIEELKSFSPITDYTGCLLYTSPSPRDLSTSRMPSSA